MPRLTNKSLAPSIADRLLASTPALECPKCFQPVGPEYRKGKNWQLTIRHDGDLTLAHVKCEQAEYN